MVFDGRKTISIRVKISQVVGMGRAVVHYQPHIKLNAHTSTEHQGQNNKAAQPCRLRNSCIDF